MIYSGRTPAWTSPTRQAPETRTCLLAVCMSSSTCQDEITQQHALCRRPSCSRMARVAARDCGRSTRRPPLAASCTRHGRRTSCRERHADRPSDRTPRLRTPRGTRAHAELTVNPVWTGGTPDAPFISLDLTSHRPSSASQWPMSEQTANGGWTCATPEPPICGASHEVPTGQTRSEQSGPVQPEVQLQTNEGDVVWPWPEQNGGAPAFLLRPPCGSDPSRSTKQQPAVALRGPMPRLFVVRTNQVGPNAPEDRTTNRTNQTKPTELSVLTEKSAHRPAACPAL